MKALIIDHIHEDGVKMLKEYCEVDIIHDISSEELARIVGNYDILLGRATHLTGTIEEPLLENYGKLKVIGIASVGLDQFDQEYIASKGIKLINLPGVNSVSVAEHTVSLLLCGMRYILFAYEQMKKGIWNKHGFSSALELSGKTIGIIGFGNIGKSVSKILKDGFRMNILAYDPYISEEEAHTAGGKLVSLEELLKQADVVTIHTPLTEETYHLISEEEMKAMKKNAILLNAGRGGIIDENALYKYLHNNHLRFAGLDVQEVEPCYHSPLFKLENFIATPHIAGLTYDALSRAGKRIVIDCLEYMGVEVNSITTNI
ncbi:3-phosphoglycerate dehydrogenase [Peribacillus cavernae]|uniref:3-phosphoglycerate dehydrogenase n=1 Tax=Peribacillus cavernae TaxID=1674310 RepID=A0A3S0VJT7_9BACI|nr:NAD(P)-dependent oxidoreductase [Peribacillus cavernae]MDQ0219498.1 D-3-phosphoglycerate dehydrogenase [Peribacillus cavernae]RUQ27085.1 3-phosphoglycerate dehydrogenase [Peribacillus cavernae]